MADELRREPQRSFTIIYNDFIDSEEILSANEKLLYLILLRYGDTVFPSLNTLSRKSGLSRSTVQRTLDSLIEKKLIVKTRRYSEKNGGYTSNLYYVRDNAELWQKEKPDDTITLKDTSEDRLLEEIKNRPALLERIKKELSFTDQSKNESTQISSYDVKSTEYVSIEEVKSQIEYDYLLQNYKADSMDLDAIISIIYEIYNTTKDTIRVSGEDKPKQVVLGVISKLDYEDIISVLQAYKDAQHDGTEIKNHEAYLTTMLYKAKLQNGQRLNNLGRNNHDW